MKRNARMPRTAPSLRQSKSIGTAAAQAMASGDDAHAPVGRQGADAQQYRYGRNRQRDLLGHHERREDDVSPTREEGEKSMHALYLLDAPTALRVSGGVE